MTQENQNQIQNHNYHQEVSHDRLQDKYKHKRRCLIVIWVLLILLLLFFIIALILILTVFKVKEPRTQLVSASVEGVAPRVSFPVIRVELNITFNLQILVQNRNHASFKHGAGKSVLFYNGSQVGEADIPPGNIPARRSAMMPFRLTIQVDEMASEMNLLIRDVLAGEVEMETRTRIPGRVNFLGIFRKHAVAISVCQIGIGIPDLEIRKQDCKQRTKF